LALEKYGTSVDATTAFVDLMENLYSSFLALRKKLLPWYKNIWFVSLGLYSLWILIGVIYYKYIEDWTFSTAFFYAIEAGLSIGFCDPTERTDPSRLFTVVYVLLGSSVVVGSLGGLGNELLGNKTVRRHFLHPLSNSPIIGSYRRETTPFQP
jgi:hypothetical protein